MRFLTGRRRIYSLSLGHEDRLLAGYYSKCFNKFNNLAEQ